MSFINNRYDNKRYNMSECDFILNKRKKIHEIINNNQLFQTTGWQRALRERKRPQALHASGVDMKIDENFIIFR